MTSQTRTPTRETVASAAGIVPAVVPSVDGLRGLASLLVAIFHCWVFTDAHLGGGDLRALVAAFGRGVDFFFVISGFVLFLPVVLRGGSFDDVRAYLVRRAARIVPAYYVSLAIQAFTVRWLTGFPLPFTTLGGWIVIVAHLLFLQHELPASLARAAGFWGNVMGFGVNGVVWSLSVEALFYVTLPLVAAAFFRRPARAVVIAVATSLVWRALALRTPSLVAATTNVTAAPRLLDQFPAYLGHFAFGMSAAMLYVRVVRDRLWRLPTSATATLAGALVVLLAWTLIAHGRGLGRSLTYFRQLQEILPSLVFAALLALAAIAPVGPLSLLERPAMRWLGDVSYGVFLWHQPMILVVRRYLRVVHQKGDASFFLMLALVIPASLLAGWLSRRYVEEPAIAWARRRTASRRA
ncbi:MAG: acyltransferase [Deltaproteobacteria bacterium]|nr:acyltransferase [Deltaproteobacteria bacterium]